MTRQAHSKGKQGRHRRRDRRTREDVPAAPRHRLWRWPLVLLVLVFIVLLAVQSWLAHDAYQMVPYSQVKAAAREGRLRDVAIAEEWVQGVPVERSEGRKDKAKVKAGDAATKPWRAHRLPDDPELTTLLDQRDIEYRWVPSANMGWAWIWLIPLVVLVLWLIVLRRMSAPMRQAGGVVGFAKSRARVAVEADPGVTFADVAGLEEAVEELQEIVECLKTPERFRRLGGKIPKGVLLVGSPGTGKTLLARAVAGEAKVPFFSLSGSEFVELFVGVGAARVRDLFQQAQAQAPCIIFIDELDALGKARAATPLSGGGNEEREQTLNQLLAEMDGFDPRVALIVLSATNRPEVLDPALLRPGRFDRHIVVDRPDRRGRRDILRLHTQEVRLSDSVDLDQVAASTPGFAGADLANLVNEAALLAARRDADAVELRDFDAAVERVVAGLAKRRRQISEPERRIIAYHEAGHALLGLVLEYADPVHKVSIVPHGMEGLGFTMQLPLEDRYLLRREELDDKLAVLLGGRAAEEVVFGTVTSGAGNNLERATDIARRMVCEFGMSEAVGPLGLSSRRRSHLLEESGRPLLGEQIYSEQTAQRIDAEVKRLVEEALHRARSLLRERRDLLERIALKLLEQEVLGKEELSLLVRAPSA